MFESRSGHFALMLLFLDLIFWMGLIVYAYQFNLECKSEGIQGLFFVMERIRCARGAFITLELLPLHQVMMQSQSFIYVQFFDAGICARS